jgi:hypothetical protein
LGEVTSVNRKRALWIVLALAVCCALCAGILVPAASADSDVADKPAAPAKPKGHTSGISPLPGDAPVPLEWMPPGSKESPIPSDEIFPPQSITIRFNHKKHVKDFKMSCKTCHEGAYTSNDAADRLMPDPAKTCDACHDVTHQSLANVVAGSAEHGQCKFCHMGEGAGEGGRVARFVIPSPNLRFPHKKHLVRNIGCAQCHGKIEELELATREQLPRMAGCFSCHMMPVPSRGEATGECTTCHLTEQNGKMLIEFTTGQLLPPDWLHMSGHTPDWIDRHKSVAPNDSQFCASCHKEEDCTECHDGKVRPRRVHPNDYITMHQADARLDNPRCTSCHQETSFCGDCHRRVGVARDGPVGNRPVGARFHPPPSEFTYAPRGPEHHAWEAQRNLNTCVACHAERDCATCHATRGLRGGGVNPHPPSFVGKCADAFSRNPRPCLVCHQALDIEGYKTTQRCQ